MVSHMAYVSPDHCTQCRIENRACLFHSSLSLHPSPEMPKGGPKPPQEPLRVCRHEQSGYLGRGLYECYDCQAIFERFGEVRKDRFGRA